MEYKDSECNLLNIGNRVKIVSKTIGYVPELNFFDEGTIVGWSSGNEVYVDFDNLKTGHDCGGASRDRHGQNARSSDLLLISSKLLETMDKDVLEEAKKQAEEEKKKKDLEFAKRRYTELVDMQYKYSNELNSAKLRLETVNKELSLFGKEKKE